MGKKSVLFVFYRRFFCGASRDDLVRTTVHVQELQTMVMAGQVKGVVGLQDLRQRVPKSPVIRIVGILVMFHEEFVDEAQ